MTSGRSGFPKLRQSVMPMASAPTHARLRHTSAMAIAAPLRASSSHSRPLQSTANARCFSMAEGPFGRVPEGVVTSSHGTRTTAASEPPGRRRVPPRTMLSYWRMIHWREPRFGEPTIDKRASLHELGSAMVDGSKALRAGSAASSRCGRSYFGAASVRKSTGKSQTICASRGMGASASGS
jgi:hypothetical protein